MLPRTALRTWKPDFISLIPFQCKITIELGADWYIFSRQARKSSFLRERTPLLPCPAKDKYYPYSHPKHLLGFEGMANWFNSEENLTVLFPLPMTLTSPGISVVLFMFVKAPTEQQFFISQVVLKTRLGRSCMHLYSSQLTIYFELSHIPDIVLGAGWKP